MKQSTYEQITRAFLLSAAVLFVITAAAKLWSANGEARILGLQDPVLMISNRGVLLGVGLLELVVAGLLFFQKSLWLRLSLVAWMASNFVLYRVGLVWTHAPKPCGCLGTITDALPFQPHTIDLAMKGLLGYLLVGSVGLLLAGWWLKRKSAPAASGLETPAPTA